MKQQCSMAFIYLSWALYLGGLAFFGLKGDYLLTATWFVLLPLAQLGYLRFFPSLSRYMGYCSVQDSPATSPLAVSSLKVTLYTAFGCPFCPIVKSRLLALQGRFGFALVEVDVTARPGLLTAKGIMSVPVVEAGAARLVGNATSEQLARLLQEASLSRA